jgi:hypothetical protein
MGPHPAARHHAWVKIALSWVPRICCPGGSCQIPGVGAPVCITMARVLGLTLILLGLFLMYAVCAPIAQLPGQSVFKHLFLM